MPDLLGLGEALEGFLGQDAGYVPAVAPMWREFVHLVGEPEDDAAALARECARRWRRVAQERIREGRRREAKRLRWLATAADGCYRELKDPDRREHDTLMELACDAQKGHPESIERGEWSPVAAEYAKRADERWRRYMLTTRRSSARRSGHRRAPGARPIRRRGSRRTVTASRDGPDDGDSEPPPPGVSTPPTRRHTAGEAA
jgi:hypothetical protein